MSFAEDFYDWDERSFAKVEKRIMRDFRNLLFDRKVYTPRNKTPVYKHIANLLVQPWQEWPLEEPLPNTKKHY